MEDLAQARLTFVSVPSNRGEKGNHMLHPSRDSSTQHLGTLPVCQELECRRWEVVSKLVDMHEVVELLAIRRAKMLGS